MYEMLHRRLVSLLRWRRAGRLRVLLQGSPDVIRTLLIVGGLTLLLSPSDQRSAAATDGQAQPVATPRAPAQQGIVWHEWGEVAFDRAKKDDKLILLDLTALWCHACHVMDRTTYADPGIVALVNSSFVPIRVDTDRRPDIEARYRHGGWPTTAVLMHTGEILFQANFLEAEELQSALKESRVLYAEHKHELEDRAARIWAKVETAAKHRAPPDGSIDKSMVDQSVAIMQESFDVQNGGFTRAPKFFDPDAITFAFLLYHRSKNEAFQQMALKTLHAQLELFDPVWGGFYRYAEGADWSSPHYEKLLETQALNLQNYLEAYQSTGDRKSRAVAERTLAYVTRFLFASAPPGFYSSHDADVRVIGAESRDVPGAEYFALGERERLSLGLPAVDRTVYTSANAQMITSSLRVYQVLGDEHVRDLALRTLDHLYTERYYAGRGMARLVVEGVPQGIGLLGDQVTFAAALVEAYLTTGEGRYLERSERLVADLTRHLEDEVGGGFFDRPRRSSERGLLRFPYKPIKKNLRASTLLSRLHYLTGRKDYLVSAERTLRFVMQVDEALPVALVGLTVDRFLSYPVHVVVIGDKQHRQSRDLFNEALRLYAPGKIVRFLDPKQGPLAIGEVTFPNADGPRAYICTDRFCSKPIGDPEDLEETLALVLAA